jgi:signal transduction histidine kinase
VLTANAFARQRDEEASRATAALQASEDRGRLAIEAAGLGTWRWDVKAGHIVGSDRFRSLMNLPRAAIAQWSSTDFVERICADDREQVMKAAEDCLTSMQTFEIEYRANDDLGTPRWLRVLGRSLQAPQDQTIVGVLADITAQKKIEAERLDLLRRLSDAQENVQARIARELHDQVGQTVTGLSLGLKGLERLIEGADRMPSEVRDLVLWLQGLTGEIGRDLHRVAADLRPTALDDLGLSRSLAAYVADWSERYAIGVEVERVGADTARLPPDVETAVYRVVQEALTNVVKHASAQHVSVVIERRSNELRVLIEDDGVGFDPVATDGKQAAAAPAHRRLGLSGMRERLTLVGGTLQIESSPEAGTTLFVRVPIPGPAAATARS